MKDTPPAELTRCPARPLGFPTAADALIPADVRAAMKRLALAFAENTAQLERLIEWNAPGACDAPGP